MTLPPPQDWFGILSQALSFARSRTAQLFEGTEVQRLGFHRPRRLCRPCRPQIPEPGNRSGLHVSFPFWLIWSRASKQVNVCDHECLHLGDLATDLWHTQASLLVFCGETSHNFCSVLIFRYRPQRPSICRHLFLPRLPYFVTSFLGFH